MKVARDPTTVLVVVVAAALVAEAAVVVIGKVGVEVAAVAPGKGAVAAAKDDEMKVVKDREAPTMITTKILELRGTEKMDENGARDPMVSRLYTVEVESWADFLQKVLSFLSFEFLSFLLTFFPFF